MKYLNLFGAGILGAVLWASGCSKPADNKPAESTSPAGDAAPAAEHTHGLGPHGGVVFDLGSEHAEFTVDHGQKRCFIFVLDADGSTLKPIAATGFTLAIEETKTADGTVVPAMTLAMEPEGAAEGKAAKFVGTDLGMANVAEFAGTVSGEIDGKPAQGSFTE